MFRFLIRPSSALGFIEALALLFGISWLDLATGHQVSLVLFYTVPIVAAVWLCDNKGAYVIAGLAGVLWSWTAGSLTLDPSVPRRSPPPGLRFYTPEVHRAAFALPAYLRAEAVPVEGARDAAAGAAARGPFLG